MGATSKPIFMNRNELINCIRDRTGMSKKDIDMVLRVTCDVIETSVVHGDPVTILGFGTFTSKVTHERAVRIPGKGEVTVPSRRLPKFVPGGEFKSAVNAK